jgi:predicted RNA-binding protein with PUA-like domain
MRSGQMAFLYQSACKTPGVVGIVKIVREAYPDDTQFDPKSKYYDAKSTRQNPKWYMVDIKLVCPFYSLLFDDFGILVQHRAVCVRMVSRKRAFPASGDK